MRGKPGQPPATRLDLLYEGALRDDTIAERYGWTPDQIDDAPYERVELMLAAAAVRQEVELEKAERARAAAAQGG